MSGDRPRVTMITGASSGIGRAAAREAAGQGEHLVLVARGPVALKETADECVAIGAASVMVVPTDVGDDAAVARCVKRVLDEHGRIDAVVSAAGVVAYGRTEELPAEIYDGVLRTNLLGSVNVVRHVVPVLRRQGEGSVVLVGSLLGQVAIPTMSAYVLSKWGVQALARQVALENRDVPGVRIRHAAPGGVDTPIYDQAANYAGYAGRPPPPATSAARAGAQVLRRLGARRLPEQLTAFNYPVIWGYRFLPRVYDALIGAAFPLGATDLTKPVPQGPGNVLESREARNGLDGRHDSAWVGIAHNVAVQLRGLRR